MNFQIKLENKEYNEAVKRRLEELGWKMRSRSTLKYKYIYGSVDKGLMSGDDRLFGSASRTAVTLNDLYTDPEKYRFKKKEKVTWYRVVSHLLDSELPCDHGELYRSKEEFLEDNGYEEPDLHFIHLEEVCSHEY